MNKNDQNTRRNFLKTASSLAAVAMVEPFFECVKKTKPFLSFSTLGCPKWSFETIVTCAAKNGYHGIELRGLQGQLDLTKCPEFSSPARITASKKLVVDSGLKIVDLGSSAKMHIADPTKRKIQLDEAKRFIDLAVSLNCPYVRVFPDDLPKEQDRNETIELIINGLRELGDYAKGSTVSVLLESHGKVVSKDILHQIMQNAENSHIGLIWDVWNMWSVTKEPPKEVHEKLKKYIRHIHIKDAKLIAGKEQYVPIGQGEAPLSEAIKALRKDGYKGYYSFEWEKMWHPDIEEPENVLPFYPKAMQKYF